MKTKGEIKYIISNTIFNIGIALSFIALLIDFGYVIPRLIIESVRMLFF